MRIPRRLRRTLWTVGPSLAIVVAAAVARGADATEPASDGPDAQARALATDLFDAGVKKMEDGRCEHAPVGDAGACASAADSFQRAFELYPEGLGALRNLAYVEKSLGRVASAARHFRELARRAPLDPRPARQLWADFARKELTDLEPRVPHLLVQIGAPPPRTAATIDGAPLPREAWGVALELDPGAHAVRVDAPDHVRFEQSVTLAEGESRTIAVTLAPRAEPASLPPTPPPIVDRSPHLSQRTLAIATAGVGVVVAVVGLGLGAAAIVDRHSACDGAYCDPAAYAHGRSLARASTVVTSVGAIVAAGGVAWFFLAPDERAPAHATAVIPWASLDGAGVSITSRF